MARIGIAKMVAFCWCTTGSARDPYCPAPWSESQCLGSSGELGAGPAVPYKPDKISWEAGMKGHSHYKLDPKKTALFVIDPQKVYSACPEKLDVPSLVAPPGAENFDGHSPLCCENFFPVVRNANKLAKAARNLDIPVYAVAHVYRSTDGDDSTKQQWPTCGRLCDFDPLGWAKWPMMWNLWNANMPWSAMVYMDDDNPDGFYADYEKDFYSEKTTYSAFTKPVLAKLKEQGVDTVILTGFMTQYCITTSARNAHDLGFRVMVVSDAVDGPKILQLLSGVDEKVLNLYLGIAVTDTIDTKTLLGMTGVDVDSDDAPNEATNFTKLFAELHGLDGSSVKTHDWTISSTAPLVLASLVGAVVTLVVQRLVARSVGATARQAAGNLIE